MYPLRADVPFGRRCHLELAGFIAADRLFKFETQNLEVLKEIHTHQRTRNLHLKKNRKDADQIDAMYERGEMKNIKTAINLHISFYASGSYIN